MKSPKVFIILLNFNAYQVTRSCILSLQKLAYPNYAAIILDNGSNDLSGEKLANEFPQYVHLRSEDNLGFAEGCNVAVSEALNRGAEMLWLLNNDTEVAPLSLSELVKVLNDKNDLAAVGSITYYFDQPQTIWFLSAYITWGKSLRFCKPKAFRKMDSGQYGTLEATDYLSGSSMLIKKEIWEKVGPLDARYFSYGEEIDWCIRAKKLGFQFLTVTSSKIWHKVSLATGGEGSLLSSYYKVRNILLLLSNNYGVTINLFCYLTYLSLKFSLLSLKGLYDKKNRDSAVIGFKGIKDYLSGNFGKAQEPLL